MSDHREAAGSPTSRLSLPCSFCCPLSRGSSTCFRKAWGSCGRGAAAGGEISSDRPARALVCFSTLWAAPGGGRCPPPAMCHQKAAAGALQEEESLLARRADANGQGALGRGQCLHKVVLIKAPPRFYLPSWRTVCNFCTGLGQNLLFTSYNLWS